MTSLEKWKLTAIAAIICALILFVALIMSQADAEAVRLDCAAIIDMAAESRRDSVLILYSPVVKP